MRSGILMKPLSQAPGMESSKPPPQFHGHQGGALAGVTSLGAHQAVRGKGAESYLRGAQHIHTTGAWGLSVFPGPLLSCPLHQGGSLS